MDHPARFRLLTAAILTLSSLAKLEAVPTQIVQLETGGLLAALIQARLFLELHEQSDEPNRGFIACRQARNALFMRSGSAS